MLIIIFYRFIFLLIILSIHLIRHQIKDLLSHYQYQYPFNHHHSRIPSFYYLILIYHLIYMINQTHLDQNRIYHHQNQNHPFYNKIMTTKLLPVF